MFKVKPLETLHQKRSAPVEPAKKNS